MALSVPKVGLASMMKEGAKVGLFSRRQKGAVCVCASHYSY